MKESLILPLMLLCLFVQGQQRIDLWPEGRVPNSKGVFVKDSIANERIFQIGKPRMQAFFTSQQENKGAAILIIPGGGYSRLAYEVSGYQLAKWFNTMGIHAFVLEHRLPHSADVEMRHLAPLQDAQRALKIIRSKAAGWGIDRDKIGVMGSSAGGHLAATISTFSDDESMIGDALDVLSYKPNFQILVSPVIDMGEYAHKGSREQLLGTRPTQEMIDKYSLQKRVSRDTPKAFIVHAFNDNAVSAKNSLLYYDELLKSGIPSSLHIFPEGKHAIALRNNPDLTQTWVDLCEKWLVENNVIKVIK